MALTGLQWKFISARLLARTDDEAASKVGVHPSTVTAWKREETEFLAEYTAAFRDGVRVAQEYSRKLLGTATQRLQEALDATIPGETGKPLPDHRVRIEAARTLYRAHGLQLTRQEHSGPGGGPIQHQDATPDLAEYTDDELRQIARIGQAVRERAASKRTRQEGATGAARSAQRESP